MPIGKICLDWAFLEALLSQHYALLVFGDRDQTDQAERTIIDALETLPTWRTKCTLLVDAAERRLGKSTAKELSHLLGTIESVQKRRNNVVHGRWFKAKDQPRIWVRRRTRSGPAESWDADCFFQIRKDIRDAMEALNAFFEEIRKRLKHGTYRTALAEVLKDFRPKQKEDAV